MKQNKTRLAGSSKDAVLYGRLVREAEVLYDARGNKKKVILPYKIYEELRAKVDDAYDNEKMDEVASNPRLPYRKARRKIFENG